MDLAYGMIRHLLNVSKVSAPRISATFRQYEVDRFVRVFGRRIGH